MRRNKKSYKNMKKQLPPPPTIKTDDSKLNLDSRSSSIGSTLGTGLFLGLGSSIGHNIVDSLTTTGQPSSDERYNICESLFKQYITCLRHSEKDNCIPYEDSIKLHKCL